MPRRRNTRTGSNRLNRHARAIGDAKRTGNSGRRHSDSTHQSYRGRYNTTTHETLAEACPDVYTRADSDILADACPDAYGMEKLRYGMEKLRSVVQRHYPWTMPWNPLCQRRGYKVQAKTVVADYERHEDLDPMRIQLTCVETDYGYKAFGAVIGLLTDSFPAEASELFLSVYDHQISEYLDGFGHTIKPLLRNDNQYGVVILSPRDLIPLRKSLKKASEDANRYSVIIRLHDAEDNELKFSSFATNGFDETMQYLDCD